MSKVVLVGATFFLVFFTVATNFSLEKFGGVCVRRVYAGEVEALVKADRTPAGGTENKPIVTAETFIDWTLECYEPAINGINCQMIQRVVHEELKQNILVLSIAYNSRQDKDVVQFVLPLDFNLLPGVHFKVGQYSEVLNVNRCSAEGCFIEGEISGVFAAEMKRAREIGQVVLVARNTSKISVPFSAQGFTKAYDTMVIRNKKL